MFYGAENDDVGSVVKQSACFAAIVCKQAQQHPHTIKKKHERSKTSTQLSVANREQSATGQDSLPQR